MQKSLTNLKISYKSQEFLKNYFNVKDFILGKCFGKLKGKKNTPVFQSYLRWPHSSNSLGRILYAHSYMAWISNSGSACTCQVSGSGSWPGKSSGHRTQTSQPLPSAGLDGSHMLASWTTGVGSQRWCQTGHAPLRPVFAYLGTGSRMGRL